jgi:monoterpene epsilon-lactone hydrolase
MKRIHLPAIAIGAAAAVDGVAVYREILKSTKPGNVGICGCSAGGALTAMVTASRIEGSL